MINLLFDGVVLVENLEQANKVVSSGAGIRCITLDGQVVSSSGIVRGGSLRHGEGGFIGKQEQMVELEGDVTRLQKELETIKTEKAEKIKALDSLELKPYRKAVKALEKENPSTKKSLSQRQL